MKNVICIFLAGFFFSCADKVNKEAMVDIEDSDMLVFERESENFTLEKLASEKLLGYFELLKLQSEHPEFKEDIFIELRDFSKEELVKTYNSNESSVENIRQAGKITNLSDSTLSLKLYYDIVSKNLVKTDSITSLITTKTIVLDGRETKSRKITFPQ